MLCSYNGWIEFPFAVSRQKKTCVKTRIQRQMESKREKRTKMKKKREKGFFKLDAKMYTAIQYENQIVTDDRH